MDQRPYTYLVMQIGEMQNSDRRASPSMFCSAAGRGVVEHRVGRLAGTRVDEC